MICLNVNTSFPSSSLILVLLRLAFSHLGSVLWTERCDIWNVARNVGVLKAITTELIVTCMPSTTFSAKPYSEGFSLRNNSQTYIRATWTDRQELAQICLLPDHEVQLFCFGAGGGGGRAKLYLGNLWRRYFQTTKTKNRQIVL